jgi:hypothetical protein
MFRFKKSHLFLLLGLIAPSSVFATEHYCIAVNGGFGNGGTTFIGTGFAVPAEGQCIPWSGFTKTASTVILTTTGTGCLSSNGEALTLSLISASPTFLGTGANNLGTDYIELSRSSSTGPFSGQDYGPFFGGNAEPVTCTSSLLHLPSSHD